jgi:hypothetical protein
MPPWRTRAAKCPAGRISQTAGSFKIRQVSACHKPFLVTFIAVLVAAGVIADPGQWYRWMPIFFGIWLAGMFLGLGLQVRLVRYYVVAGVALAGGPLAALLPLSEKLASIGVFFAAVGAVLLAWGVLAFVRFLQRHPLPAEGNTDVSG